MKNHTNQLAINGGEPAFARPLHVGAPNLPDRARFLERVNDLLDRRWLTNGGRYVQELETALARFLGVRDCLAVCNGTAALEILTRALDLEGEVIVPALTFVATAHALRWVGLRPVFADVEPEGLTLDPGSVEAAITPRTSAILGVHLWGRPCDVDGLQAVADRHGLALIFDAAHAFGCTAGGRMVGSFGRAETFSFHATKVFNTLEGGAIATDDPALAEKVALMRNFGFLDYDQVVSLGTNGKMDEISAAMGLGLLECLDELIAANRRNYDCYRDLLAGLPGVRLLPYDEKERCNYHYIIVEIDPVEAGASRDQLAETLWAENVYARRYFYPGVHRMQPYASEVPPEAWHLPVTERAVARLLALPNGAAVGEAEVREVCGLIRLISRGK